jgi:hypothetical protein
VQVEALGLSRRAALEKDDAMRSNLGGCLHGHEPSHAPAAESGRLRDVTRRTYESRSEVGHGASCNVESGLEVDGLYPEVREGVVPAVEDPRAAASTVNEQ